MAGDDAPKDLTIDRARREVAALGSIVDIFEPLTPDQRKHALAAVLCHEYVECADAAIRAFQAGRLTTRRRPSDEGG